MLNRIVPLGTQLLEAWRAMPLAQRMTLAVVTIGVAAMLSALGGWAGSPEYQTILAKLSDDDMTKVAEKLQTAGIDFKINGRSLAVPSTKVSDARVAVASAGISNDEGQPGFKELFKGQNPLGITDEMHRVNYQRSKEGELAVTLRTINGVENARVHLVLPPPTFFSEKKGEASASVTISPKGGRRLDDARVQSIVSMVTSAVEGLKARSVTVIDTSGNLLHDGSAGGATVGAHAAANHQAAQQTFEDGAAAEIRRTLEVVFGSGNAAVRVAAVMDWDQRESIKESYENPQGIASSERKTAEFTPGGANAAAGGTPGTASNVPNTPTYQSITTGGAGATGGFQKVDELRNLQPNKTVEKIVTAPGTVKRLSIMAVIDEAAAGDVNLDEVQKVLTGWTDQARGDTVVLTKLPFNKAQLEADKVQLEQSMFWSTAGEAASTASSAILPLGVLALVFLVVMRGMPRAQGLQLASGAELTVPVRVSEIEMEPPAVVEAPRPQEDQRAKAVHAQIVTLAKNEPETVSGLITTLLDEQRR